MARDDEPDDLTIAQVPVAPVRPVDPQAPEALWADLLRNAPLARGTGELPPPPRRAPGFQSEVSREVDVWTELTPAEVRPEAETDAAVAVIPLAERLPDPEDTGAEEQVPEAVVEDVAEAPDPFLGDGPFAEPLDRAPRRPAPPLRRGTPGSQLVRSYFPADVPPLGGDIPFQRRVRGGATPAPGSGVQVAREEQALRERARKSETAHGQWGRTDAPPRRYPRMRALLKNPEHVPLGSEVLPKEGPPPVPGTFFPAQKSARRPPPPRPSLESTDLDDMLVAMAEGLLVGEGPDGGTEVRVTLKDEFFAGTELRISVTGGRVRARLVPPDRGTYFELNSRIDELRVRLEDKGLRVEELVVADPE